MGMGKMKKIITILLIGVFAIIAGIYSYDYMFTGKLSREFLEDFKKGNLPVGHPQKDLIIELREADLHNKLLGYRTKVGVRGSRTIVQLKVDERIYSFSLSLERDGSKEVVLLEDVVIVTGYLIQKQEANGEFRYIIESNDSEIVILSKMDFEVSEDEIIRFILVDGDAIAVSPLEEVNISKVLHFDSKSVTGEVEGTFKFLDEPVIFGREERLYIGQRNVDIYLKAGNAIGVVTREEFIPDTIRVLINDTGFRSLHHHKIQLYSKAELKVYCKITDNSLYVDKETIIEFRNENSKLVLTINGSEHEYFGRVYIESDDKIYLNNIKRGGNNSLNPGYRGSFEIFVQEEKMHLVNEIPVEQYLYGVIPSEMPLSFGFEALKVQAIAARSYSINNLYCAPYRKYSAHVVDSVMNQVYNNTYENEISNKAVDSTKGKVIIHNDRIIDAKFFSTSSGYTANSHEVWEQHGKFPAPKIPYLISKAQGLMERYSIATEEAFEQFIQDDSVISFDSHSPFFRWNLEMTEVQLRKTIEANLASRFSADPNRILTYDGNKFVSKDIPQSPLGSIKELKVSSRGQGGNLTHLDIIAENGTYRIEKEFNIRFTLRPVCDTSPVIIERLDGSTLVNYSILPSAFVSFEQIYKDGKLEKVVFYGGGNGHGVGMSQYGVVGMIRAGYQLEEIIAHYYEGAQLKVLY